MGIVKWRIVVAAAVAAGWFLAGVAAAEGEPAGLKVTQEKVELARSSAMRKVAREAGKTASDVVRVTVGGRFEAVVCDGWGERERFPGGLGCFFDLVNDPERKYDYACPWGGGLLRPGLLIEPRREHTGDAHAPILYASPGTVELVESNPVRAVVRYVWSPRGYGDPNNPLNPDVRCEQTFAFSAPDRTFMTLTVEGVGEPVELTQVGLTLHTSHAKFAGGKVLNGGAYSIPGPWTFLPDETRGPKNYILHVARPGVVQHADGTESRHKADFLLVVYESAGTGYAGNRGNRWLGYRTTFLHEPADKTVTKDKRVVLYHALLVASEDQITDLEKAAPYVREYCTPGVPKCRTGAAVDDGYDETTGAYTMKAEGGAVDFDLPVDCHWPVFQVDGWGEGGPAQVTAGGKALAPGEGFVAHAEKGRLLVQVRGPVAAGTRIAISARQPVAAATRIEITARPAAAAGTRIELSAGQTVVAEARTPVPAQEPPARVALLWSTTFDCPEWKQSDGDPQVEMCKHGGGWTCEGTHEDMITVEANHAEGGGGKGFRHWEGDGTNHNGGGIAVVLKKPEPEIWIRWYMRYEKGFKWERLMYDKIFYMHQTPERKGRALIPEWMWGTLGFAGAHPERVRAEPDLWKKIMGGEASDGKWHYHEIHMKMDTDGTDGIGQWWVDDRKVIDRRDLEYGAHGGWQFILIGSNQAIPSNGRPMAVDFDDMAIGNQDRIGPLPTKPAAK